MIDKRLTLGRLESSSEFKEKKAELPKKTKELDVDFLSKQTPGFSGADIANVCNESALIAARKGKKSINKQDFLDAVDRIIGGMEKVMKMFQDFASLLHYKILRIMNSY